MNKMKRVFSLVLAFAIVLGTFGSFAPVFAAEAKTETKALREVPKDVIGTEYEDAVRRLVAFGIIGGYPDGTYKPEDIVNRAQFAKIIVEALGLKDAVGAAAHSSTGFSDVYDGHWATGYINVASGQGLITGYPDGTFKAEQDVTYAEALTMLVRALGYRDEFLQGQWPGNYISKAADAGITRGVNIPVNAQVGAQRGYIANLVNNALDAKVVKVDKYTQGRVDYYETDIPLLKDKLEISKYENTRIVADKIVDDGLAKDEIRVKFLEKTHHYDDKNYKRGEIVKRDFGAGDFETFRFENTVAPRELIGEEAITYVNDHDRVIYAERAGQDKAYFDYIEGVKDNKLELVKFDREYAFETEDRSSRHDVAVVNIFNNDKDRYEIDTDVRDIERLNKNEDSQLNDLVGRMGKFVVKNNRIVYAEIMDPQEAPNFLVVMKNDAGQIEGINNETEDFKKDLRDDKDYDGALVYNTKGEEISLKDIEKGNVLYIQEQDYDGDDYAVVYVVQDNKIEGEMGRVKHDRVDLGDKTYKVVKNSKDSYVASYSVRGLDEVKKWDGKDSDWEDDMEDAYKQDVVAYTDATGRIAFLTTEGGDSGYKFGIVTRTYADGDRIRIYTTIDGKDGKDQVFKADKEVDIDRELARMLDKNGVEFEKYVEKDSKKEINRIKGEEQTLLGSAVKFRLDSNGEIAKDKFFVMPSEAILKMTDDFGKDIVKTDRGTFAVNSDATVVIDAATAPLAPNYKEEVGNLESVDSSVDIDDFNISTWKDIKDDNENKDVRFFIFPKTNKAHEVDGFVFVGKEGANTGSDEEAVYVIDQWKKGDKLFVEYVKYPQNTKETREVDQEDRLTDTRISKETAYVGKEKSNGKIALTRDNDKAKDFDIIKGGKVTKVRGNYITVGGKEYLLSGSIVYEEDKSKTTSYIKEDMYVDIITDGIRARVVGVLEDEKADEKPELKDDQYTFKGIVSLKDGVYASLVDHKGKTVEVLVDEAIEADVRKLEKNATIEAKFVTIAGKDVLSGFKVVEDEKPTEDKDVKAVIAKIADLPKEITLDDKDAVKAARKAYDALSKTDQKLVTNIVVLEKAEAKIIELENEGETPEEKVISGKYEDKGILGAIITVELKDDMNKATAVKFDGKLDKDADTFEQDEKTVTIYLNIEQKDAKVTLVIDGVNYEVTTK